MSDSLSFHIRHPVDYCVSTADQFHHYLSETPRKVAVSAGQSQTTTMVIKAHILLLRISV